MTVKDLWDEWTVGIDSNPPIRDLETNTRKKWRSGDKTENKYFERRKVVIDAVQALIDSGAEETAAVASVEERRATMTLNQLRKELVRNRPQQQAAEQTEQ